MTRKPTDTEKRNMRLLRQSASIAYRQDDRGRDSVPEDMDLFRFAMTRRIVTMLGTPRRCRESVCRRSKRCMGPTMRCRRDFPLPKTSPERSAAAIATVYKALQRRLAELDAAE
jgi:hypothetical protein